MMIRRLKVKQRHGCDYCRKEGNKTIAIWRDTGFNTVACEKHKADLEREEEYNEYYSNRYSDADFQLGLK